MTTVCPLCGIRRAKRSCPALGRWICPTCCATKRLREIACPDHCPHLIAARAHPPAVVQRQRERDLSFFVRLFDGLAPVQLEAFSQLNERARRYRTSPRRRPRLPQPWKPNRAGFCSTTRPRPSRHSGSRRSIGKSSQTSRNGERLPAPPGWRPCSVASRRARAARLPRSTKARPPIWICSIDSGWRKRTRGSRQTYGATNPIARRRASSSPEPGAKNLAPPSAQESTAQEPPMRGDASRRQTIIRRRRQIENPASFP
jgi:hypothetical protein